MPILVSPEAALAYWRADIGKVDPFLLSMARELVRPGMTVWDVGANVGLFAFSAAALGATVVAIEPDLKIADLMRRSVILNFLPVTVLPVGISDQLGISKLYISDEGRASNSMIGTGTAQTTITVTLDWLLNHFPAPQLLKIDVEGAEYDVLKGAGEVLSHGPIVFCEVSGNHDSIADLLRGADYQLFAARESARTPLRRPSRDTVAIPRLKTEHLAMDESSGQKSIGKESNVEETQNDKT